MRREVLEELGIEVLDLKYNSSQYFKESNTLMFNFTCVAVEGRLDGVSDEIDNAEWFSIDEAREKIKKDSLAQFFLEIYIIEKKGVNHLHYR